MVRRRTVALSCTSGTWDLYYLVAAQLIGPRPCQRPHAWHREVWTRQYWNYRVRESGYRQSLQNSRNDCRDAASAVCSRNIFKGQQHASTVQGVLPLYPHSKQLSAVLSEICEQVCACNQGACLARLVIPQASAEWRRALLSVHWKPLGGGRRPKIVFWLHKCCPE